MRSVSLMICLALLAAGAPAATAPGTAAKVAVVNFEEAVLRTHDAQLKLEKLRGEFKEKREALAAQEKQIDALRAATPRDDAALRQKTAEHDSQAQQAQQQYAARLKAEMEQPVKRMGKIVQELAAQRHYALIVDVSTRSLIWSAPSSNITREAIALYDARFPAGAKVAEVAQRKQ